jgi:hypothetical protein
MKQLENVKTLMKPIFDNDNLSQEEKVAKLKESLKKNNLTNVVSIQGENHE